jgi:hypothetical protein
MPGYRSLPDGINGKTADDVRDAELLQRSGDLEGATSTLEAALLACCPGEATPMPGWLCGRLAALYRSLKRYDDEVALLERYEATQLNDDARARYKARLSKARSIAASKRRPSNGALDSVQGVLSRPRRSALPRGIDASNIPFPRPDARRRAP